jgi:hypothetical protein
MVSDDGGSAAQAMKKYLDHIIASDFKKSSGSASAKNELVTNAAARFSLGDSLAMEAGMQNQGIRILNHAFTIR